MNTGHFWTTEEDQELLGFFSLSETSKTEFCKEYAKIHEISFDAVRIRLNYLLRKEEEGEQEGTYEQGDDFINIICSSRRMLTKEDVIKQFKVDIKQWEVEKFKVKTSEGYRKDRKVIWKVVDGKVIQGDVDDSGKMLVVPLYHIEVRLIRKTQEIRNTNAIEELIRDAKRISPKYPKVKRQITKDGMLYEIGMPDLHFGRLTWAEETGEDYDIKIARGMVNEVLEELLSYTSGFSIKKILLPIGNDFFNANNKEETTTHGTPQQEDTRWQKTFRAGRIMATEMIDACASIAPVDVVVVPGNHDEERIFYLGDALVCWYHSCPEVSIDNASKKRKYYQFGNSLIGFTHGSSEKNTSLASLMPLEVPELWSKSRFREWHTGDKHHKSDMIQEVEENIGVVIRILRSLVPADAWTFEHGLIGAVRAAEGFLWHPQNGLNAQFTALPSRNVVK